MNGAHDYHPALPGYHPDQVLVDGCHVCEERADKPEVAWSQFDNERFALAWGRATEWGRGGDRDVSATISRCEARAFAPIWVIIVQLERRGIPLGTIPTGVLLS